MAPLPATRTGSLFNAHAYPTKISPESAALLIACHTKPGDLVFDGFGGSCTTALGALLCSNPPTDLQAMARRGRVKPNWGPRRAIVYELGGLGSFIGQTLCSKPDPLRFAAAASRLLDVAERQHGWMYRAPDDRGNDGYARYFIWSEILVCPSCFASHSLWDVCVELNPARIENRWKCPRCGGIAQLSATKRISDARFDVILQSELRGKARRIARVDGLTGSRHWSREPREIDLEILNRVRAEPIPKSVPVKPMMNNSGREWGDLWRAGYHEGITHVHHFYTRRNLIALGTLFDLVENEPKSIRNALRFWISSYNSSHSTLMTRVVAKQGQPDLVLTSGQSGVLYISGLPVEKNVFHGLRRKANTIQAALFALRGLEGQITIRQGSSTRTNIPTRSVDYVFTDPPFGGNIPYSEVNFISEAWLNRVTQTADEAIVSPAQGKNIVAYENLLTNAFREIRRVLKPTGKFTLVFHSTQAEVWDALTRAYSTAGFSVKLSSILDKTQSSFKQVTATNSAKGDPMLLLMPRNRQRRSNRANVESVIERLLLKANGFDDPRERTPQRMYSRFVAHYLQRQSSPPINADEFYDKLALARSR